ncbi:long-chain fatty acid--CoA ligase [bacterium]|nr:long-chain fatty acid--CoA ligase [bacterium]MCI0605095.1 long-chain fatty acid--CoA ligase [bacterium]
MNGMMMDYPLTLDRILEHARRLHPQKRILTKMPSGEMHSYDYAKLYQRSKKLANVLEKLGVKPGDRVGTLSWNNFQHMEMYYGIPCSGAVCHTLNIRLSPEELAYLIDHAEDQVIFVDGTLLPLMERVAPKVRSVRHYVLFNTPDDIQTKLPGVSFYEDLMADASEDYEWKSIDENMAAGLCYTSGTTGNPKGALYSHRSIFLHTLGVNLSNSLGIRETDVMLPVVPMFHAMAWGLPYGCVMNGADMIMPGPHMQPAALAALISDHRVTIAAGVPTIWGGLYQELKARPRDISSIRALIVGGAAMPRSLIEGFEKDLGVTVLHAWGMTEMSPLGTVSILQSHHTGLSEKEKIDVKSMQGYPVPMVELRIADESGREQSWDGKTMGEIQVRGPWVIRQYYKVENTPDKFTGDGWFRTGDVATINSDGFVNITDRTKDVIKSGGEWISSVALENALMSHPKVLEAAVIAVPDPKWTERPLAVIVAKPDSGNINKEEIVSFLAERFPRFWLPDHVSVIPGIPKTSVGKFDKKVLRKQYSEGSINTID